MGYTKKTSKRGYGYGRLRKRGHRRFLRRRRKSNLIRAIKVPGRAGFPDEYMCKLVYVQNGTFAGGVSSSTAQVFTANSLYDPDSTGTGHQPLFYDQLTAVYGKYVVMGMAYRLELTNGATSGAYVVATFNETDIGARSVEALSETTYAKRGVVGPISGQSNLVMKGYMSMAKLHGQSHIDQDPNQYATSTGNPSDGAYFIIRPISVDGTNCNLNWRVELTYYCKFKDLQQPTQS